MKKTPHIDYRKNNTPSTIAPVACIGFCHYNPRELATMTLRSLSGNGFYPVNPRPINVEEFADSICYVHYEDLGNELLGKTVFCYDGMPHIYISTALAEPETLEELGMLRFVFAHEVCHVIIHNPLYKKACDLCNHTRPRYNASEIGQIRTACFERKDVDGLCFSSQFEYQASRAGAYLLMPPELLHRVVFACLGNDLYPYACGKLTDLSSRMLEIVDCVQSTFAVGRKLAEFGVRRMFRAHHAARAKNLSFYEMVQMF